MSSNLRKRMKDSIPSIDVGAGAKLESEFDDEHHPAGPVKHSTQYQTFLMFAFFFYFVTSITSLHSSQWLVLPVYLFNANYYYAYIVVTKEFFGIIAICITHWFTPTVIRISGDASVQGQLRLTKDGRLETVFPERLVMIANHQIYTEWLYLWWIGYTSRMHGHIYIILKESLKWVPIIGPGMQFFGFIFLARNWAKDRPRFASALAQLRTASHSGPKSGSHKLDPMWLIIFPEGTNLSNNGRKASAKWAEKNGLKDMQHCLLPRSTGLQFCLQELGSTVEWVYDCTIAYEGVARGSFGQDIYTLRSTYFQGRVPPSVNMYWRRFPVSSIPISDPAAFEIWLRDRWTEKDVLIEQYLQTGRFPANNEEIVAGSDVKREVKKEEKGYLETEARCARSFEWVYVYIPLLVLGVVAYGIFQLQGGIV